MIFLNKCYYLGKFFWKTISFMLSAAGLYYLAELVEEYTVYSAKVIKMLTFVSLFFCWKIYLCDLLCANQFFSTKFLDYIRNIYWTISIWRAYNSNDHIWCHIPDFSFNAAKWISFLQSHVSSVHFSYR